MTEPIILRPPEEISGYYKFGQRYLLSNKACYTFGSNLAGVHGKGAAKTATLYFGALFGVGQGFSGRSYAIPTKDEKIRTRKHSDVVKAIKKFVEDTQCSALEWDHEVKNWFYVTPVGTGLAGFRHEDIAPHFQGAVNCWFPDIWKPYLGEYPALPKENHAEYTEKFGYHPELYIP